LEVSVGEGSSHCCGPGAIATASLVLVRRGALVLQSDGAEQVADPCTGVLLWERAPPAHGDDHLVIELGPRLAAERLHGLCRHRDVALPLSPRLQLAVAELAAALRWQPEQLERSEEVVARAALELVDAILGAARARATTGPPRRLALAAILALHRDLSINRSIEELAEELGCSPYHLMHAFRAEIGDTVRAYRLRARLGVALHRLVDGHGDLATLAIELGFASHSHLTETFTRELGISPSRLRAQLQERACSRAPRRRTRSHSVASLH
jgi:AraC-like DNA-binding protein